MLQLFLNFFSTATILVLYAYLAYHFRVVRTLSRWAFSFILYSVKTLFGKVELRWVVALLVILAALTRHITVVAPAAIYLQRAIEEAVTELTPVYYGPDKPTSADLLVKASPDTHCEDFPGECRRVFGHGRPPHFGEWFQELFELVYGYAGTFWQEFGFLVCVVTGVCLAFWTIVKLVIYLKRRRPQIRRGYEEILEMVDLPQLVPEKMASGSVFVNGKAPKIQCEVYVALDGGNFTYAGQAFRVGDDLWTAWHVVSDSEEVRLINRSTEQQLDLKKSDFKHLEGDVAVAKLGNKLSQLSLASGKFSGAMVDKTAAAFVEVFAVGKRSFGLLTPHTAFGYATYSGSTIAGFSGAPYIVNNTICGMHLGHQGVNLGYDAAYLSMLARGMQESTEDYIYELIGKYGRRDLEIQNSPYNPDEVRVRYGGKYYLMAREDAYDLEDAYAGMDETGDFMAAGDIGEGHRGRRKTRRQQQADDRALYGYDSERAGPEVAPDVVYADSGNGLPASAEPVSAAAGALGQGLAQVVVPSNVMQKQYPIPTLNLPRNLATLVTNLPASTPVQQNEVSDCTLTNHALKGMIRQTLDQITLERERVKKAVKNKAESNRKKSKIQLLKNQIDSLQQQLKVTNAGASTSALPSMSISKSGSRNA